MPCPPGIVGEIIDGVLYTMTKPRARHQRTGLEIGSGLLGPFDHGHNGPGGWWILSEPGIELPNTPEISPDVAGWRRERMPELPADEAIRVVPDWVCEILSPTTRHHDMLRKLPYYAKVGVPFMWLVDIDARVLTAHRLESSDWRIIGTYGDETEARIEPFDAVPAQHRELVASCRTRGPAVSAYRAYAVEQLRWGIGMTVSPQGRAEPGPL